MVISLFEKWQQSHACFVTEDGELRELWVLLTSARELYKKEGVPDRKRFSRFLADFRASHTYVNCDKACCKNTHEKNLGIACEILERADLLASLMEKNTFDMSDCETIRVLLDTTDAPPPAPVVSAHAVPLPPLSFGCNISDEQMVRISSIASANHLFCVSEGETVDLKSLLLCEKGTTYVSRNNRLVALLFSQLLEKGFINWNWKNILERSGILQSKTGKPVKASTLSSALAEIKKKPTAESVKFENELENYLLMSLSEMK